MKRLISIILVLLLLTMMIVPVSASGIKLVESAEIATEGIVVKGNTGRPLDSVTMVLLRSGVTVDALADIENETEFCEKIAYATVVTTDYMGSYEKKFKTSEATEGGLLYVTNEASTEVVPITRAGDSAFYTGTEYIFNFVDYRDGGILFKGRTDIKEKSFKIVILKPGYIFEDYRQGDESSLYVKAEVTSDEYAGYETHIEAEFEDGKKYNAYLVTDDINSDAYGKKITTLQKPAEIYVSRTRTGKNIFSSITAARDYLRTNLKDVAVDVIIDGGEYNVSSAISFTKEDVRTTYTRVKYTSKYGEEVVISGGGNKIDNKHISEVTDHSVLDRVYDEVKDRLVEIDLAAAGISENIINFTDKYDGIERYKVVAVPYVYLNGNLQSLAQWPNNGFANYDAVIDAGASSVSIEENGDSYLNGGSIQFNNTDKLERWKTATDLFLKGYFCYAWTGEWAKVESVDTLTNAINFKYATANGIKNVENNNRFAVMNLLEEIDVPGEWFIDKSKGKMYYLPPYELTEDDALEIGGVEEDIINISGAKNIIFENLTIEQNCDLKALDGKAQGTEYNNGIEIKSAEAINIQGCTLRNIAVNGIAVISKSANVWVDSCRIYNTGFNGILLVGQNAETLESTNYIVSNCHITDVSLNGMKTNGNAVQLTTTGAMVENNVIHNMKTNAISYVGSENVIRNNEIYNSSTERGDSGAIYTGRRWDSVGNVIEKNYIHKIGLDESVGKEIWYIYFDDSCAGNTAKSNILVGRNKPHINGVQLAQGPNNVVNSNIFVNFGEAHNVDTSYRAGFHGTVLTSLLGIPYDNEVYSARYPYLKELAKLYKFENSTGLEQKLEDKDPSLFDYAAYEENMTVNNNLTNQGEIVFDEGCWNNATAGRWWITNTGRGNLDTMDISQSGNVVNTGDVFVNSAIGDYRVDTNKLTTVPEGVLTEDFDLNKIGILKKVPDAKKFKLLYPLNGEVNAETSIVLSWEKSYDADCYEYVVAKEENFSTIFKSGTTTTNFAEISGLDADTTYYWKVEAKTSARIKESWGCEQIFAFSTYTNKVNIDITYGNISAKDEQGEIVETPKAGEKISVTDVITSDIPVSKKLVYVFAVYNGKGSLIYTKIKNITVVSNKDPVLVMEFIMPELENTNHYKIFRWESFKTLRPIY